MKSGKKKAARKTSKKAVAKKSSTKKRSVSLPNMSTVDGGSLDQVRDILFGAQSREFNEAIGRLDEKLSRDIAALKGDTKSQSESFELYVKNELQSLSDRIDNEQAQRKQSVTEINKQIRDLGKELNASIASLDKRLGKLDEKMDKSDRTLRGHILDEAKSIRAELESKYEAQASALASEAEALRESKTDRGALADLLKEMAVRLTGDEKLDKKSK